MPSITAIKTPTYSLIRNEIPNNLPPEIFKMLAPASQRNYIEGKKQIEINIHNGMENQLGVVHYFFSIPEREVKFSLFEWLRWCLKLNMPRDYNTWVSGKDEAFNQQMVSCRARRAYRHRRDRFNASVLRLDLFAVVTSFFAADTVINLIRRGIFHKTAVFDIFRHTKQG